MPFPTSYQLSIKNSVSAQGFQQGLLGNKRGFALLGLCAQIAAIGLQYPGTAVVAQIVMQSLLNHLCLEHRVIDREAGFHPVEQVAIHPVGAGAIHQIFSTMMEVVDTGVFQKASDHRAHPDIL